MLDVDELRYQYFIIGEDADMGKYTIPDLYRQRKYFNLVISMVHENTKYWKLLNLNS